MQKKAESPEHHCLPYPHTCLHLHRQPHPLTASSIEVAEARGTIDDPRLHFSIVDGGLSPNHAREGQAKSPIHTVTPRPAGRTR